MKRLTVFTPTYNRANVISRVYNSLVAQTYKDFAWLIIDDGSADNTKKIVDKFIAENRFPIKYLYQKNSGKHVAVNRALDLTESELFIIADSDDAFVPDALERLIAAWDRIPDDEKRYFKGVNCRVLDNDTKKPIGQDFPFEEFDSTDEEAYFKYKMRSEKWNLFKTSAFKEFKFPEISEAHFFPETVTWQLMAKKYKTRFINDALRIYYRDTDNSVTNSKHSVRYTENVHLWTHFINNEFRYFFYYPKRFIKSFVGLTRDGLLNGYTFRKIVGIPNGVLKKMLCILFAPAGWLLAVQYKNNMK